MNSCKIFRLKLRGHGLVGGGEHFAGFVVADGFDDFVRFHRLHVADLVFGVEFTRATIGTFDVDLIREFFQGLVNHALMTLHIDNLRGENAHHQAETIFKAFGRALRVALEADDRAAGAIPSTKGVL